jgi:hypothetical protein
MKVKLIRSNSVLVCVRCRIYRYVAAPFSEQWFKKIEDAPLMSYCNCYIPVVDG